MNDYRKAFDELSFSADFQERTADLLQQRARELEKECSNMTFNKTKKMAVLIAACVALLAVSVSAAWTAHHWKTRPLTSCNTR